MRVPRILIARNDWTGPAEAILLGKDAAHLTRVLRLGPGAEVLVLDEDGRLFRSRIAGAAPGEVRLAILERVEGQGEPLLKITLVQGLAKGDKMDLVIQKATEVGISRIVPLASERAVVRLEAAKVEKRLERWRKIAVEAAEQCGRLRVPAVEQPLGLAASLKLAGPEDTVLFFWEEEKEQRLRDVLRQNIRPAGQIFLFIGPEGGFSAEEARMAADAGAFCVTLGPRVLRTETAGLIAAALVLYELGDLG
ncbi:16S rRNA (uracil(1498)-N(3))-methyltransferase [Desulforudis sp. 1088]|uniref:16S rRNA (uracil(1498)-N(3))-methyltransferase n=2 Tax=Candidatus Desulforudis TaxID=471826 RepID=UPI003CE56AA5